MNEMITKDIVSELGVSERQVNAVLTLLSEGNTIPFIARYRKEATGGLDEESIKKIGDVYAYQENLLKRKEDVIRLIDEKGLLTDELKESIMKSTNLVAFIILVLSSSVSKPFSSIRRITSSFLLSRFS